MILLKIKIPCDRYFSFKKYGRNFKLDFSDFVLHMKLIEIQVVSIRNVTNV